MPLKGAETQWKSVPVTNGPDSRERWKQNSDGDLVHGRMNPSFTIWENGSLGKPSNS